MSFNPEEHLIQLPRRVKDPSTGRWKVVYDNYLEVKWRICWFRDRFPHGRIETEEVCVDLDRVVSVEVVTNIDGKRQTQTKTGTGYARFKARVDDGEGGVATGYGTENAAEFTDFCERAETRSVGRALAALGIGTQFVGVDLTEDEHLADAPVTSGVTPTSGKPSGGTRETLPVPPVSHGDPKPTADEVAQLLAFLQGVYQDQGRVDQKIRAVLGIPAEQSYTPFRLRNTMTRRHFDTLQREAEADVTNGGLEEDVPSFSGTEPLQAHSGSTIGGEDAQPPSPRQENGTGEDLPSVEVNAEGHVVLLWMARLAQRAGEHNQRLRLEELKAETPQMTAERFWYVWGEVATPAADA